MSNKNSQTEEYRYYRGRIPLRVPTYEKLMKLAAEKTRKPQEQIGRIVEIFFNKDKGLSNG